MHQRLRMFKLQRPLGGDMSRCLVYTRDRKRTSFVDYDDAMRELFERFGNPEKLYVRARLTSNGFHVYGVLSRNQPW